jgi:hypothetical protein
MPSEEPRDRVDLRADAEWIARVKRQAKRLGLNSVSAYVRQATTKQLIQDEQEELASQPPKQTRKGK